MLFHIGAAACYVIAKGLSVISEETPGCNEAVWFYSRDIKCITTPDFVLHQCKIM